MADSPTSAPPPANYFNVMRVSSSRREFFFDFAQTTGDPPGVAALVARLVTSPGHAKAVMKALSDHLQRYEAENGEIEPQTVKEPVQ